LGDELQARIIIDEIVEDMFADMRLDICTALIEGMHE
jgi:hypothetical protein